LSKFTHYILPDDWDPPGSLSPLWLFQGRSDQPGTKLAEVNDAREWCPVLETPLQADFQPSLEDPNS